MRRQLRRVTVCTSVVAAVFGTGFIATAAPPADPAATPRAVASTAPAAQTVRLLTGDTVRLATRGGRQQVSLVGGAGQASVRRVAGHVYVVPAAAARYVGRTLDASLFDVAGSAVTSSLRATVPAGSDATVPGLTVTARHGSSVEGYLTAAGATRLGAALAKQARSDAKAHRVSSTLFGGVSRIAPAVSSPRPVTPAFAQQTLTIKALDPAGKPVDFASLTLTNVDDGRKFGAFVSVVDGLAKVSVPTGHYAGILDYYSDFESATSPAYLVPLEGIVVGDSDGTAVFDTRKATVEPAVHTPRAAAVTALTLEWDRTVAHGSTGSSYGFGPSTPVHVAPTAKATIGRLDWLTTWQLAAAPTKGTPYTYDLSFHDVGRVPADQDRTVTAGQVARVDAAYYTDTPSRGSGAFGRGVVYPFQIGFFTTLAPFGIPVARTEYVYAPADALWFASLIAAPSDDDPFQGMVDDDARSYRPGSTQSADWLRGPLGPGFAQPTPDDQFFFCGYCRDASSLGLGLSPVADTDPAHSGTFDVPDEDTVAARFRLYRDGKLIADEKNATGDLVDVTAASATYRVVASTSRGLVGFASSTKATTDVTFVSSSTSGNAAPADWVCPGDGRCTVLPVLTTSVPLPTDLIGTMRQGSVPMTIDVGHVVGAADPAITAVKVELSFDGGGTYVKQASTSVSNHRYAVTLANPKSAAGKAVGIRITATDAAGGKLVQTALAAYTVAR